MARVEFRIIKSWVMGQNKIMVGTQSQIAQQFDFNSNMEPKI